MKKILLALFIFISTLLNASSNYELKLYEAIIPAIFKSKQTINIYVDTLTSLLLKGSSKFHIVKTCDDSVTLLIGENFNNLPDICKNKPIFSTNYSNFKEHNNSFGAFYWRKGRPQIKFKDDVLKRYKLVLPASLKRYVE